MNADNTATRFCDIIASGRLAGSRADRKTRQQPGHGQVEAGRPSLRPSFSCSFKAVLNSRRGGSGRSPTFTCPSFAAAALATLRLEAKTARRGAAPATTTTSYRMQREAVVLREYVKCGREEGGLRSAQRINKRRSVGREKCRREG